VKRVAVAAVAIAVVAVTAVVWLSSVRDGVTGDSSPGEWGLAPTAGSGIPSRPDGAFPLTVTYVYDGDTIQARMQRTNDILPTSEPVRIRLIGIDTPEGTPSPECWADEARAHLSALLPEGATVWAAPDRETRDRYDRLLFNLWTDDGTFVNHELVAAGDAEAMAIRPNIAYFDLLRAAQARAEASGAGRWGACD
jgi:micrococcal nuclease